MRLDIDEFANGFMATEICDMGRCTDQRIFETGESLSKYVLEWAILRELERLEKEKKAEK